MNIPLFRKENLKIILPFAIFLAAWSVVGLFVSGFGSSSHLLYLLQLAAFLGIVAAGQTLVILAGGIDLSVGSVITFSGIIMAQLLSATDLGLFPVIVISLLLSALIGGINGLGISTLSVPPLVMTLAMSSILQGLSLVITQGTPQAVKSPVLQTMLNQPFFFKLNGVVLVWILVIVIVITLLRKTTLGKKIYYLGSNPLAFQYTGNRPKRVIVQTYALCGLFSGCTGILLVGFTGQSYLEMGNAYQLLSIAAVILGGTSILGGKGGYLGTVAGALLLTLISSVLILLKVSSGGQIAIQGTLILALVMLYGREAAIDK